MITTTKIQAWVYSENETKTVTKTGWPCSVMNAMHIHHGIVSK